MIVLTFVNVITLHQRSKCVTGSKTFCFDIFFQGAAKNMTFNLLVENELKIII